MRRLLPFLLAILFLSASAAEATHEARHFCEPSHSPEFSCKSREFEACMIRVHGIKRYYCMHVPHHGWELPVLFAFHGSGGTANNMVDLWRKHTEQSMIIVAPQGLRSIENGKCVKRWRQIGRSAKTWKDLDQIDPCDGGDWNQDLDFVQALMDDLTRQERMTTAWAMGFSNGARFIYQLLMTEALAERLSGFAASGTGMDFFKLRMAKAEAEAGSKYGPNTKHRRPIIAHFGSQDKRAVAIDYLEHVLSKSEECEGADSIPAVIQCFNRTRMPDVRGDFDLPDRRTLTQSWLVKFNRANLERYESLYPNRGGGPEVRDNTMTVRADYPKTDEDSAHVTVLTTVDGGHDWPGWGGVGMSCPANNCDLNMANEVLSFFRAHGGILRPPP